MKTITLYNYNLKKLFDLFSLLSGKVGNILVGVFFLPLYAKYLQPEVFSIVTIFFSLQALASMLDFGMCIIVSRETAIHYRKSKIKSSILKDAECIISSFYLLVALVILVILYLRQETIAQLKPIDIILFVSAVCLSVLQNIYFSVLLTARKFIFSSWLQIVFVVFRGLVTYLGVVNYPTSIKAFLFIQTSILLLQFLTFRFFCYSQVYSFHEKCNYVSLCSMLGQGKKLVLYSIAGAMVLQLDKIIVAHQYSPIFSAPYFLASTFCMLPITVLATPIMQFFQPKLIKQINANSNEFNGLLIKYTLSLCIVVLPSTVLIWSFIPLVIKLWLHDSVYVNDVITYSTILLPGIALGALGYIPYVLLIGIGDFKFQAVMSFFLTILTLGSVYYFSLEGDIKAICITYFLYHTLSMLIFWMRCIAIKKLTTNAVMSFKMTIVGVICMGVGLGIISCIR